MNRHHRPAAIDVDDVDLRRIDPTYGAHDRSKSAAAERMLVRILDTPRTLPSDAPTTARRPARTGGIVMRNRGWATVGLASAAVAAALLLPTVVNTIGSPAFASWTSEPQVLSASKAAQLQDDCLATPTGVVDGGTVGAPTAALSEVRGDFSFTLVATDRAVGSCFVLDEAPTGPQGEQEQAAHTWMAASDLPAPPPDGTTVSWGGSFSSAEGTYTSALGRVGSDVVSVTLTAADGRRVQASVSQGYFLAWWPGESEDELTVDCTLADGSTTSRVLRTGDR